MMKCPTITGILIALVFGALFGVLCPSPAQARIGERRESIERRLFASGGIVYRDDTVEASRQKGMPYLKYFELLPNSADVKVYFKTVDGRRPTSSDLMGNRMPPGWDLHVVYVNGKSAIEVYQRSQAMNEFELNRLLAVHAGGSYWKEVDATEAERTAFGYELVRDDRAVRAKKLGGDRIMFFEAKVDVLLAEKNASDQSGRAPVSVEGF